MISVSIGGSKISAYRREDNGTVKRQKDFSRNNNIKFKFRTDFRIPFHRSTLPYPLLWLLWANILNIKIYTCSGLI